MTRQTSNTALAPREHPAPRAPRGGAPLALRPTRFAPAAAPTRAQDVERLRRGIAARLATAGVALPDAALAPLAESILADAVRVALDWLELP